MDCTARLKGENMAAARVCGATAVSVNPIFKDLTHSRQPHHITAAVVHPVVRNPGSRGMCMVRAIASIQTTGMSAAF